MKMSLPLRGDQLEAEREVVLMMMLRLLGYHQVVSMCALVLECYRDNRSKWEALSDQILPVLLPYLAKYDVTMDIHEKIASLFKLMTTISMKPYSIRALFECLISKAVLVGIVYCDHVMSCDAIGYSGAICDVGRAAVCSAKIA